ncbi:MAG TPA: hypothetical protein VFL29_11460 [Candidatus Dormibacteraeota bacterium]|nr:hypothetical protein [Candidatus Dormibacteraeota bacterium]
MANAAVKSQAGQVLVFIALVLPIVLLPAAAYAVDAASAVEVQAQLEQATTSAAETAVQQVDAVTLRSGAGLALDQRDVQAVTRDVIASEDPGATVDRVTVDGLLVTVETSRSLRLPLNVLGIPAVTLRAAATARLRPGYESPSSFLPLSVSTF